MNTIRINNIEVKLPACYGELSDAKDLQYLGSQWPFEDSPKFHTRLLLYFMKLRRRFRLSYLIARRITPEEIHCILTLNGKGTAFGWVFEEPLMENSLIKHVALGVRTYYGPSNQLLNLRMGEFRSAEAALNGYLQSKNVEYLNLFVAILYRLRSQQPDDGDIREPYNELTCDDRAVRFALMHRHVKHALMLQYMAMRQYVINSNRGAFDKKEGKRSGNDDWGAVINAMAKDLTNISDIENMRLWKVLGYMADNNKMKKNKV